MKNFFLLILLCISLLANAQVKKVVFESKKGRANFDELKNATVRVIIKDFCDDSKPYKKIIQENLKFSKLTFDFSESYDFYDQLSKGLCKKDEWYMFIDGFYIGDKDEAATEYITIAKTTGKKDGIERVIFLPLFASQLSKFERDFEKNNPYKLSVHAIQQSADLSQCFFNLGNEYYLKNILQILNQFVDKKAENWLEYKKKFMSCESLDKVLASVLYVPHYALLKEYKYSKDKKEKEFVYANPSECFSGYRSEYKVLTNEEMVKMFKSGKSFCYLLTSIAGDHKLNFIVESTTGNVMCVANRLGPLIKKNDMLGLYETLNSKEYCK